MGDGFHKRVLSVTKQIAADSKVFPVCLIFISLVNLPSSDINEKESTYFSLTS